MTPYIFAHLIFCVPPKPNNKFPMYKRGRGNTCKIKMKYTNYLHQNAGELTFLMLTRLISSNVIMPNSLPACSTTSVAIIWNENSTRLLTHGINRLYKHYNIHVSGYERNVVKNEHN